MVRQSGITRRLAKATKGLPSAREVIDATISAISPSWGIKRRELRAMESILDHQQKRLSNHFEAAEKDRLRGAKWMSSRLSPDSALEMDLQSLWDAADELYRTFPYLHGAVEHRTVNVVGRGMRPQCHAREIPGVMNEAQIEQWKNDTEALFRQWAKRSGPKHNQTFWKTQRSFVRSWKRIGEGIWVWSDVSHAGKPVPLQVQQISSQRLETPPGLAGDPEVRLGIRKRNGVPITYYIRDAHPYDTVDVDLGYKAIPAERVIHIFEELYEDQSRGLPWCFASIPECSDFKDFREAVIIAAQVQACQTLIISTKGSPGAAAQAAANSANQTVPMEPGQIMFRNDVADVHGFNPTQPGTTYGMFSEWSLFGIGAGLNYPHGWLVKDRRRASYSAGRLEEIEGSAVLEVDQQDFEDSALCPIWERVIDEAVTLGRIKIDPTIYNAHRTELLRHRFPPPGRRWIDPPKEVKAAVDAVNNNFDTKANVVQRIWGGDFDEISQARSRERKREEELGIIPPDEVNAALNTEPLNDAPEGEDNEQE